MIPRRPAVRPAPAWPFPRPASYRLANGLGVDRFDLPGQRVVSLTLLLDAPLTAEPRALEGVATLAMQACDEGTTGHPGPALTDALEGCGAIVADAGAQLDGASLSVEAPASRLAEALPLMAELISRPAYAADDVARLVEARLLTIATGETSPPVCAAKALYACFGQHRLARPGGGDAQSVARLDPAALHAWQQAAARPGRARLILAGDLPGGTDQAVEAAFGPWQAAAGVAPLPGPEPPPGPPASRVVLIDRPGAAQASLRFGTLVPSRNHPDWPALQVANAVVGAMFGSRLNRALREERGLTYGAGSSLGPTRGVAVFTAQAECRVEAAAEAARLALDLLDLGAAPITAAEARDAIAYITGATPLRLDTADAIAAQAANFILGGVGPGWFDDYMTAVRQVSADDATAAFSRHIKPEHLVVAICGPADILAPQLAAAGLAPEVAATAGEL